MADIDWPEGLFPYKTMFYLRPHVGGQESPLTRTRKVYGLSAPQWIARLSFRAGHGYDRSIPGPTAVDPSFWAARLDAFIAQMRGGLTRVRFHDFRRPLPQCLLTNRVTTQTLANPAPVGANTMVIQCGNGGVGPSIGDYIGGDGRPHIIVGVSPSQGTMISVAPASGLITLTFEPPLSAPIAAGAPLLMDRVTARWMLTGDDAGANESEVGQPTDYVLEFTEDLL